jgi:hypothetical protein
MVLHGRTAFNIRSPVQPSQLRSNLPAYCQPGSVIRTQGDLVTAAAKSVVKGTRREAREARAGNTSLPQALCLSGKSTVLPVRTPDRLAGHCSIAVSSCLSIRFGKRLFLSPEGSVCMAPQMMGRTSYAVPLF